MDLIIETDIGHDPDDYFALCYLAAAGVKIRAILICPGDPDQVAVAKLFCDEVGLDIPIGASKLDRTKLSSGSIHHGLLKKYNRRLEAKPDGLGKDIFDDVLRNYPNSELFIIGPVTSIGSWLKENNKSFKRATMQGGFCSYDVMSPSIRIPAFEGKSWMPTFNMNGDRPGALAFLNANIAERRFVGKNVCHTVLYTKEEYRRMEKPRCRAAELFMEGMGMYLERHESKKFHDPTAAACHLHPEIGKWVCGKVQKIEGGWGTTLDGDKDLVLGDIDYENLWRRIFNLC